jgi:hypothetical protein
MVGRIGQKVVRVNYSLGRAAPIVFLVEMDSQWSL